MTKASQFKTILNKSIKTPTKEPIKYKDVSKIIFSFLFLLTLNNNINPIPLPVKSPPINIPVVITPLIYKSVIKTLDAQLGIKPTKLAKNGPKKLFFKRIDAIN